MAELAAPNGTGRRQVKINPGSLGEMRSVLNRYFAHLLGRQPKLHEYLRMAKN
jgi:hypothetical protein